MNLSKRMKIVLIITSIILLINKLYQIYQAFFVSSEELAGVGIIGGMDVPTAIFLFRELLPQVWISALCVLLEILLYLYVLIKSIGGIRNEKRPYEG